VTAAAPAAPVLASPPGEVSFCIDVFKITQLAKVGLWMVTTKHAIDLGMLFVRYQEFVECINPDFHRKPFSLTDYMRWYAINVSDDGHFSYPTDFEGYNLPGDAIDECLAITHPDTNRYDSSMAKIATEVRCRQGGKYSLIGAKDGDRPVLEHEVAHGLYYLVPAYREKMKKLVAAFPEREVFCEWLRGQSYHDTAFDDEIHAYMSTGLAAELLHLEPHRHPFMKLYATYRKKVFNKPAPKGAPK